MECDGQTTAAYPALAAIVGGTVPDYRGMFLRGYGSQNYSQMNGSLNGVTSTNYSSGLLGIIQGDAARNITGTFAAKAHSFNIGVNTTGAFYDLGWGNGAVGGGSPQPHAWGFDTSRVIPTANEIRPVNIAVRYLIKAQ